MKTFPKLLFALTAVAAVSFAYPASVQAVPITYTYTGNPFQTATAPYTTSMFVSGMLTLAGPLAPNMPLTSVTPLAFSFSDGVQTFTNLTAGVTAAFAFSTGAGGVITGWQIAIAQDSTFSFIFTANNASIRSDNVRNLNRRAGNAELPGAWSMSSGVPDSGSTIYLMSLTLIALGVAARQFKRAAA